jgi:hypothetical protein
MRLLPLAALRRDREQVFSLLASLVADGKPQCTAGADWQGMYSTIPIYWNIISAPASPYRSCVGPSLYVFSLLEEHQRGSKVLF